MDGRSDAMRTASNDTRQDKKDRERESMKAIQMGTRAQAVLGAMAWLLVACGGGGSGSSESANVVQGTAAIGSPVAGGTLSLKCVAGERSATTDDTGRYKIDVSSGIAMPCAMVLSGGKVDGIDSPWVLSTAVTGPGVANLTPWTHLVMARLLGKDPATAATGLGADDLRTQLTAAKLGTANAGVRTELGRLLGAAPSDTIDPITTAFTAARGDGMDDLLERVMNGLRWSDKTLPQAAQEIAVGALKVTEIPQNCRPGVLTGFTGKFDDVPVQVPLAAEGGGGSSGGSGSGDAGGGDGAGAGGSLGQFLNAIVRVERSDGSLLGEAVTDDTKGMVTVVPCRYQGPVRITMKAKADGSSRYYEESTGKYTPFPAGEEMNAVVPLVSKNLGITLLTEAAWQYMQAKHGPEGWKTVANVNEANTNIGLEFNKFLPKDLQVTDITRLPFLVGDLTTHGSIDTSGHNGVYGIVSSGLARAAGLMRTGDLAPALKLVRQLGRDLCDGQIDLTCNGTPVVADTKDAAYLPPQFGETLNRGLGDVAAGCGNTNAGEAVFRVTQIAIAMVPGNSDPGFDITWNYTDHQPIFLLRSDGKVFSWANRESSAIPYLPQQTFNRIFPQFGNNFNSDELFSGINSTGDFLITKNGSENNILLNPDFSAATNALAINIGDKKTAYIVRMPNGHAKYYPHYLAHPTRFESVPFAKETEIGNIVDITISRAGTLYRSNDNPIPGSHLPEPVPVDGLIYDIRQGNPTFFATTIDGSVYAWGNNSNGFFGNGEVDPPMGADFSGKLGPTVFQTKEPIRIPDLPPITNITKMQGGILAIDRAGHVWGWGSALISETIASGKEGFLSNRPKSLKPTLIKQFDKFGPIQQINCTHVLSCIAKTRTGKLLVWGTFYGMRMLINKEDDLFTYDFPVTEVPLPPNRKTTYISATYSMPFALLDDSTIVVFPSYPGYPQFIDPRKALPFPIGNPSAPTCKP